MNLAAQAEAGSGNQLQPFYLPDMFCAAGEQIDAGGVNTAVAQHIRQPDNILEILIKYYGK